MNNIVEMPRYLTSSEFYTSFLKKINFLKKYHRSDNPIILDFAKTVKIEPLVIPNLLCLGRMVMGESGTHMVIRIPETLQAEKLKYYLNEINFLELAQNNIYRFESDPFTGIRGKTIDPLCGTLIFEKGLSRNEIINGISGYVAPFSEQYLEKYNAYSEKDQIYVNKVDHFLYEIIDNCRLHGKSDSILTLHARYSDRKIYVAISDIGVGFFSSWISRNSEESDADAESYLLSGNRPSSELETIMCGVYKRRKSKIYGLYNIIIQTLELGGKIRIHSNNTQVLFTPRLLDLINQGKILQDESFRRWNVKEHMEFRGVHIEMEIPF